MKLKTRPSRRWIEAAAPADTNTTLRLNATATIEFAAAAGDGTTLPRFKMVAYTGNPMRVMGWRQPDVLDLAGLSVPSQSRPIRFGHDPLSGVGHTDAVRVEGGELVATGVVSRDTPAAREVVTSAKNGFPWQASVGASVEEYEFVKDGQTVLVNGRSFPGPLNVVRKGLRGALSLVIPTLGRPTLPATLDSVVGQLRGGDEVWIVSDGPRPDALTVAQRYAAKLGGALVRFADGPATPGGMGGPQRNLGMRLSTGSHLLFMDDDDVYLPGALDAVRRGIAAHHGVPILFRMRHRGSVLWTEKQVRLGNVSTQMVCVPNVAGKLGVWPASSENDYAFIRDTVRHYPADALGWRDDIIADLQSHAHGR